MKTPLLIQSIGILFALSMAASRASELDRKLGLSIENVSTNSIAITSGLLESVTQNLGETSINILDMSPDPFFPEVVFRTVLQWSKTGGEFSGRVVARQFSTGTNALQWTQSMVHGSSMAEETLALHYSMRPDVDDICLCWHVGETNTLDSSISSVTIVRGNLVCVASGTRGTNLVEAASSIMDALWEREN